MKKSTLVSVLVVVILVIVGIIFLRGSDTKTPGADNNIGGTQNTDTTASAPVSEVTKVSNSLSEYQNAELGFAVKYPSAWQNEPGNSGITFVLPIDKNQVSTVGNLQATIQVLPGTCAFPPVTTVKDRSTLKVGDLNFNTISMSNTVKGINYFNRMYSLQKGSICYMFSFASVTLSPSSKGLTGSNATQAENNNKAIVNTSDAQFTDVVKSFKLITGPQGVDETKAAPIKK